MRRDGDRFTSLSGKKYDSMIGRCYRQSSPNYRNYGGRGIRVCASWLDDISTFRLWFIDQLNVIGVSQETYIQNSGRYTLDRIDVNGPYAPENCRIVSPQVQGRNRRKKTPVRQAAEALK